MPAMPEVPPLVPYFCLPAEKMIIAPGVADAVPLHACGHDAGTPSALPLSGGRKKGTAKMERHTKVLGRAERIRVRVSLSDCTQAWDCRPFGFGRIVAPVASGCIEIAPHVELDLGTGEIRAEARTQRRSA
jgi:hypothetical protein